MVIKIYVSFKIFTMIAFCFFSVSATDYYLTFYRVNKSLLQK